jgi:UDP-N-acetylmuramate dehydrogenase
MSDEGFEGLVVQPNLNEIQILSSPDQVLVKAGAGASMHDLILFCLENSIIGLEEFSGIPGTVGGSLYINLHYYEFLLEQFLLSATVLNKKTNQHSIVTPDWFAFGYNKSKLQEEQYYLLDATFILKKATDLETAFARGRRKEIIRHREKRYPSKNTCGSFFRNFLDHEVTLMSNNKKIIYVAYYLDKIGVKGHLRVGDAIVSHQHANMIVNQGNATSTDIITLARTMQELVQKEFGIIPQPECRLIGFKKNPLL